MNVPLLPNFVASAMLVPALALLAPAGALADPSAPLSDRVSVSVGTFMLETSTRIRVDGSTGNGTVIDGQRDLGLQDSDRFRIDAYWRFRQRHKIRLMYFDTKHSSGRTIDRDLHVGDTVFPIEARLEGSLETRVGELAYEYAFLRRDNYEVTGSIGVHNLRFALDLSASQTASGQALGLERVAHAEGPLPVVGLRGLWRLSDRFYIDGQAQFFRLSFDPYSGRLEDYTASLVWMPFRHVGFGVGYNVFVTRLDVSANQFDGDLQWRYGGARIFATASF